MPVSEHEGCVPIYEYEDVCIERDESRAEVERLREIAAGNWLIPFTDDELEAIYDAIEQRPAADRLREETLRAVLNKITPSRVGDPRPDGALNAR